MDFEQWREANPEAGALTIWQAAQKALADDLFDYAQHDSWRCGYQGECHCGLNAITEKYGLPAVPLPEKGDTK